MRSYNEIDQILGECSEFYKQQTQRLLDLGPGVQGRAVSHVAHRTETCEVLSALTSRRLHPRRKTI